MEFIARRDGFKRGLEKFMEDMYQWLVDMMAICYLWITGSTSPNPSHSNDGQKRVIFLLLELMTGICLGTVGTESQVFGWIQHSSFSLLTEFSRKTITWQSAVEVSVNESKLTSALL